MAISKKYFQKTLRQNYMLNFLEYNMAMHMNSHQKKRVYSSVIQVQSPEKIALKGIVDQH